MVFLWTCSPLWLHSSTCFALSYQCLRRGPLGGQTLNFSLNLPVKYNEQPYKWAILLLSYSNCQIVQTFTDKMCWWYDVPNLWTKKQNVLFRCWQHNWHGIIYRSMHPISDHFNTALFCGKKFQMMFLPSETTPQSWFVQGGFK